MVDIDLASQADSSDFRALLPQFHGIGLTVFWILASRVELASKACLQPHILRVRKDDLMQSAADSCYFSSRVRNLIAVSDLHISIHSMRCYYLFQLVSAANNRLSERYRYLLRNPWQSFSKIPSKHSTRVPWENEVTWVLYCTIMFAQLKILQ